MHNRAMSVARQNCAGRGRGMIFIYIICIIEGARQEAGRPGRRDTAQETASDARHQIEHRDHERRTDRPRVQARR